MQDTICSCKKCNHRVQVKDDEAPFGVPIEGFLCKECQGHDAPAPKKKKDNP